MKKIVVTIIVVLMVLGAGAFILMHSGLYDISILNHDNGVINWALDKGMTRSVQYHAQGIHMPELLDAAMVRQGFEVYKMRCVGCHGAPGVKSGPIAEGLWPTASNLAETVPDWKPAELFWITKNGIKFTAMPAWGPSYNDDQIWAIVAYLEKLPHLTPAEYAAMKSAEQKKS